MCDEVGTHSLGHAIEFGRPQVHVLLCSAFCKGGVGRKGEGLEPDHGFKFPTRPHYCQDLRDLVRGYLAVGENLFYGHGSSLW